MEALRNVPEVTVDKRNDPITNSPEVNADKTVHTLVCENKRLKTSVHWLSDELNKLKNSKSAELSGSYIRSSVTSGCLEEGINNISFNFSEDVKTLNVQTYIQMLHKIIKTLKSNLSYHVEAIKKLSTKTNSVPKLNYDTADFHKCLHQPENALMSVYDSGIFIREKEPVQRIRIYEEFEGETETDETQSEPLQEHDCAGRKDLTELSTHAQTGTLNLSSQ